MGALLPIDPSSIVSHKRAFLGAQTHSYRCVAQDLLSEQAQLSLKCSFRDLHPQITSCPQEAGPCHRREGLGQSSARGTRHSARHSRAMNRGSIFDRYFKLLLGFLYFFPLLFFYVRHLWQQLPPVSNQGLSRCPCRAAARGCPVPERCERRQRPWQEKWLG